MVHHAYVDTLDLLAGQRFRALLTLQLRLSKPARRFVRVDYGDTS